VDSVTDDEFKKQLADYFTGPELLDLLDVPMDELVDLLEDYIGDKENELKEYINYGTA
jgi:hypothetical protein